MKITALEEYGLRCLLRVVESDDGHPISAGTIAEREGLSAPYAQKLLRHLSDADLVASKRGPNGGYYLDRPAKAITLGEVLRELGGLLELEEFCQTHTGNLDTCTHSCSCSIRPVWAHVSEFLMETLDRVPLTVLTGDEQEVQSYLSRLEVEDGPAGPPLTEHVSR